MKRTLGGLREPGSIVLVQRIAVACERALVEAARSTGLATRRRARRAARRFIRRHRTNLAYLAWVMRRVAAQSSLALALLGLGSRAALAGGAPVFDPFAINPLATLDAGSQSSVAMGDLDADGDLDLVSGELNGAFRYFQNTGNAVAPAFSQRTGSQNPANASTAGTGPSRPALADLDGDGDLDLLSGLYEGGVLLFLNIGDRRTPIFSSTGSPLTGVGVSSSSSPSAGDLDRDGDLDLVSGNLFGGISYFENTGSRTNPAYVARAGSANPFSDVSVGGISIPALGDADGDGDLDLVSGNGFNALHYYQNTGTARRPVFKELVQAANPLRGEATGTDQFAAPGLGDIDGDGDLDVVAGKGSGDFVAFENQIGTFVQSADADPNSIGQFGEAWPQGDLDGDGDNEVSQPGCRFALNSGSPTNPAFAPPALLPDPTPCTWFPVTVDLDRDGDLDFVADGVLHVNTGGPLNPSFGSSTTLFPSSVTLNPPLNNTLVYSTFGDVDRDGDLDAAVVYVITQSPFQNAPTTAYFENTGSPTAPAYVERSPAQSPLPDLGTNPDLKYLGDVDGDGDTDGFAVPRSGSPIPPTYFENVGATAPSFVLRAISDPKSPWRRAAPLSGIVRPPLLLTADFDGDGDADAFGQRPAGAGTEGVFLENGIIRPSPKYFGPAAGPFTTEDAGSFSSPAAGDLDGDGDVDFVSAESFDSGTLHYYQNTGTAVQPRVAEQFGAANPFDSLNAGWTPILSLVDLDRDGDLDLVAGSYVNESLRYFQNTGTTTAPAFVERVLGLNPLQFIVVGRSSPSFGDLDADGDPDLVLGSSAGTLRYFKNDIFFLEQAGTANPFDGFIVGAGFMSNPTLGDVDRDGDLDLIAGDEATGGFFYYENTGSATTPAFVARTGLLNPLDGKSVGLNSTPTLVDIDSDGDLDVVAGERNGTFKTYTLPEPSIGVSWAMGFGLLAWLRRCRRSMRPRTVGLQ